MPLLLLALVLLLPLFVTLAMPFILVQRYRLGTARRRARSWVAVLNLLLLLCSAACFVWAAAFANFWVPRAFFFALVGLASGGLLALVGLLLTRWEESPRALHYTPNRWLVLVLTFAVAARLLYGIWRALHAWGTRADHASWLATTGLAGSLGVGALVLGYYLIYHAGIWRRLRRLQTRPR